MQTDIIGRRVWLFYNAIGAVAQCPYNWGVGSAFHPMKIHIFYINRLKDLVFVSEIYFFPDCKLVPDVVTKLEGKLSKFYFCFVERLIG